MPHIPSGLPPVVAVGADSFCRPDFPCPQRIADTVAVVLVHSDGSVNLITSYERRLTLYRGAALSHIATMLGVAAQGRLGDPETLRTR